MKPRNTPWNKEDTCECQCLELPKPVMLSYARVTFVHLPGKAHVETYPRHLSKSRNTRFGDKDDPCGHQHLQYPKPIQIELCKNNLSYTCQGRLSCNRWVSLLLLRRLNSNMVVHLSTTWFTDVKGAFVCPQLLMCVGLTDKNPTAKDNIDDTLTPLNHFSEPKVKANRE